MKDVSDTELAILNVLWDRAPVAVREIVETVYGQHSQSLHTTVKSLLERLINKGYVTCDRTGFVHTFSATIDRERFVGGKIEQIADSVFGGQVAPILLSLVDRVRLNKKDREAIERILRKLK